MKRKVAIAVVAATVCMFVAHSHAQRRSMVPFVGVWKFCRSNEKAGRAGYLVLTSNGRWSSWSSAMTADMSTPGDRIQYHRNLSDGSWTASNGAIACQWDRPSLSRCGDLLVNAPVTLIEELITPDRFDWDITWTGPNSFEAVQNSGPIPGVHYLVSKVAPNLETFTVAVD